MCFIALSPECTLIFFASYQRLRNFERSIDLKRITHVSIDLQLERIFFRGDCGLASSELICCSICRTIIAKFLVSVDEKVLCFIANFLASSAILAFRKVSVEIKSPS